MSFINSIVLGKEGYHETGLANVSIEENDPFTMSFKERAKDSNVLLKSVCALADKCLNSKAFGLITQGYIHTFVHELGHAASYWYFTGKIAKITIVTKQCSGYTRFQSGYNTATPIQQTIINAAGPLTHMTFCNSKLILANVLKNYMPRPIRLTMAIGSIVWMTGELLYNFISLINEDNGDYGSIAKIDRKHAVIATGMLVAQYAAGVTLFLSTI